MKQVLRDDVLIRGSSVSTRTGEEWSWLYCADTGTERLVNPIGLAVWELFDGVRSLAVISRVLADRCEAGVEVSQVEQDSCAFAAELLAQGFAERSTGCSTVPAAPETFARNGDSPRSLDVSVTGACNLRCAYCFYADEMTGRSDLVLGEWVKFFGELKALGVRDLTLSGGEVFVRKDFWDLLDAVIAGRMRYGILTNGTLIDERVVSALSQPARRQRLNSIQVSIDGSCPAVHDRSRGEGSFVKAIRGLRMLKEAGFPVTSRCTINRYNVDDLENVARLLLDDVGLPGFSTNDAMPMGAGCSNQADITLLPDQQIQAMLALERLGQRYPQRVDAQAGPQAKLRMYREMELARLTGSRTQRWQMGCLTACGCVFSKLSIHHDGTITPCNMLSQLIMGHINRDSLSHLWQTHATLQALRERRSMPMSQVPGCGGCEWTDFCNGSCPGLAYEMTGELNRGNPHDCYRRFLQKIGAETRRATFMPRHPEKGPAL